MTSLQPRQNNEAWAQDRQTAGDQADLNSALVAAPAEQPWFQTGSAADLDRSLEQVNQQIAWLQANANAAALEWRAPLPVGPAEAPISTTLQAPADELLGGARQSLQALQDNGQLDTVVMKAFSGADQQGLSDAIQGFLTGERQPLIQWARFANADVGGAYLAGRNTMLISESLRSAPQDRLQSVVLEELGHWLDDQRTGQLDTTGDEGAVFAALLRDGTLDSRGSTVDESDAALLLIDGQLVAAELNKAPSLTGSPVGLPDTQEDTPLSFTTADLLSGFTDPDAGNILQIQNLRVTSNNGTLVNDGTGALTFTPTPDATGVVTLAYDVIDGLGGVISTNTAFEITALNDPPRRSDDGPRALYLIEDSPITPLGLDGLSWESGPTNEVDQTLTFTVTALPPAALGLVGLLATGNTLVPLQLNQELTLAQLQALQFFPAADANGTGTFSYAASDAGGETTTDTFSINVLAVNDAPVDQAIGITPPVVDNTALILESNGLYRRVSLGLADLQLNPGGDQQERDLQTLRYRVVEIPDAELGVALLPLVGDVEEAVAVGGTYTIEQLRTLEFRPTAGIEQRSADQRLGYLRFEAIDEGNPIDGPQSARLITLPILVDTNAAAGRAGIRVAGLTNDDDAIRAVLALDPSNPEPGFRAGQGINDTAIKGLNPLLYRQLNRDNPLYLAEIGGTTIVDGREVNYTPSAVPFVFDLQMASLDPASWAFGGLEPTHTLYYRSTLSGQLRSLSSDETYSLETTAPQGFTFQANGAWSFDPFDPDTGALRADYADLTAVGATRNLTINYRRDGQLGSFSLALTRTENTVVVSMVDGEGAMTTSRGDWIAANPEGLERDRYFKYVSEFTLTSYGALDTGERDEKGEKIFAWDTPSAIRTADGQPLRLLDGTPITKPGYYDFTRRNGDGDGVEFIYETILERGKEVEYIVGMRFFLKNNMFGDNDPDLDNIRDPGAPITFLRELGVVTTLYTSDLPSDSKLEFTKQFNQTVALIDSNTESINTESINILLSRPDPTIDYPHAFSRPGGLASRDGDALRGTNNWDMDATSGGSDGEGQKTPATRNSQDGSTRTPGQRGFRLDPQTSLAIASESDSFMLQLSETNLLGANLLDALALGAGLLYVLYGPKAVGQARNALPKWLGGGAWFRRNHANRAALSVLMLLLSRKPSGEPTLMALTLDGNQIKILGQHRLPNQQSPTSTLQSALASLLHSLPERPEPYDLLMLDNQLESLGNAAAGSMLQRLGIRRLSLGSAALVAAVGAANPAELGTVQAWLNQPSAAPPQTSPIHQALLNRRDALLEHLTPEQAMLTAMVELSQALTWRSEVQRFGFDRQR
ncbi:hypothetical protein CWE17_00010 [Synechococcus sp. BS56D]|uniref:tandem-95 repeat protein n=1 Tax=Synechococcus sp. BS56D TaxID=2055944 RepID=UPI00103FA673|nr:cadherin-like domain-containing protein [Synechococcus sp. BS56D]TCD59237.1 hypothetical protein CWE17_00010 [Synechococcus sp. BS56D]